MFFYERFQKVSEKMGTCKHASKLCRFLPPAKIARIIFLTSFICGISHRSHKSYNRMFTMVDRHCTFKQVANKNKTRICKPINYISAVVDKKRILYTRTWRSFYIKNFAIDLRKTDLKCSRLYVHIQTFSPRAKSKNCFTADLEVPHHFLSTR